jgi:hypothetical protein
MVTRRGSRPSAAINSETARDQDTRIPLNSQRFPSENSSQNSTEVRGRLAGDETPAEHIRNTLQMVQAGDLSRADVVAAIEQRLRCALAGLEAQS